jgi:Family of unknown function (DUF6191)
VDDTCRAFRGGRRGTLVIVAFAFALTIPGLAVGLVVLGVVDVVLFRRRGRRLLRRHGSRDSSIAPVAYDEAAAFFMPGKRTELEVRQAASMLRDHPDDGAPPTTAVDLERGTVVVRRTGR